MATNDVWRLSCIGSHAGTELAVITMHIRMKTNVGTFDGAAAYIKTNLLDLLKTKEDNGFRWDKIVGLTRNTTPKVSGEYSTGFPLQGTVVAEGTPRQAAIVVTHKTAYAGRSYRGRHYIPSLSIEELTGELWNAATVSGIQTYYDDLVAALGSGGANPDYEWVVWSDKLDVATPVTQAIVRNNPGVIRRRRIGVGQ